MSGCIQCGMWVDPKNSYHPYAACLMFMGCKDGNMVQANLDSVRAHGAQYDSGFDDWADRKAQLESVLRRAMLQIGTSSKLYQECELALMRDVAESPKSASPQMGAKEERKHD